MIFIVVSRMLGARCFALSVLLDGMKRKKSMRDMLALMDRAVEGVQYALGATRVQGRRPKGSIKIRGYNEQE
jgi:hypothetical protein